MHIKVGFVFLIKKWGHTYNEIEVYDVNSMYSAMMLKLLPISNPIYKKGGIFINSYCACFGVALSFCLAWNVVRELGGGICEWRGKRGVKL
ncbi:DNA polymerase [Bartonella sp. CR84HXZ]|uniref:DNA polymerase n=1 Tax=Bartonella sp. CR84HXZ TaxID=1460997 RepID=UPI0035CEDADE